MTMSTATTATTATTAATGATTRPGSAGVVPADGEVLRGKVRDRYAAAAKRATAGAQASCCGPETGETIDASALTSDPITSGLYSDQEAQGLPEEALLAS